MNPIAMAKPRLSRMGFGEARVVGYKRYVACSELNIALVIVLENSTQSVVVGRHTVLRRRY